MGIRKTFSIIVVPYREGWPDPFRRLNDRLNDALGLLAERTEHIGRTAVPEQH
jgi:GrpB-like predicted nucleotidyltransferase (UPF0157 family)